MEFYAHAADAGRTADSTDRRSARPVTLDGDTCTDSESIHIQIKRAAVLSVERERGREVTAAAEI